MISLYNGVQAEIEMQYHLAIYMHWGFHIWNLTLVKASRLDLIQMPYGYLQKVYFSCSLKKTSESLVPSFLLHPKKKTKVPLLFQHTVNWKTWQFYHLSGAFPCCHWSTGDLCWQPVQFRPNGKRQLLSSNHNSVQLNFLSYSC